MTPQEFKTARYRAGLFQHELAMKLGVSRSSVSGYEAGTTSIPFDIQTTLERLKEQSRWQRKPLRFLETKAILRAFEDHKRSIHGTAKALRVDYSGLYRYLRRIHTDLFRAECRKRPEYPVLRNKTDLLELLRQNDWNLTRAGNAIGATRGAVFQALKRLAPKEYKQAKRGGLIRYQWFQPRGRRFAQRIAA